MHWRGPGIYVDQVCCLVLRGRGPSRPVRLRLQGCREEERS